MPARTCDGNGLCGAADLRELLPLRVRRRPPARRTCAADSDCVAPNTCQGSGAAKNCTLKANGVACTAGSQCISGNCIDSVCCGSASCPACQACNVGNLAGAARRWLAERPTPAAAADQHRLRQDQQLRRRRRLRRLDRHVRARQVQRIVLHPRLVLLAAPAPPAPCKRPMSCGTYGCTTAGCKTSCATSVRLRDRQLLRHDLAHVP